MTTSHLQRSYSRESFSDNSRLLITVISVLLTSSLPGDCWPEGAPFKTCVSRFPKHRAQDQQSTSAPYEILVNQTTYSLSQHLLVTIRSMTRTGDDKVTIFKGFQISARRSAHSVNEGVDTEESIGHWITHPLSEQNTRLQFWYPEAEGEFNCATHQDNGNKTEIFLLWRPAKDYGDVIFKAGIVQDYSTFWTNVESAVIHSSINRPHQPSESSPETNISSKIIPIKELFTTADCGLVKGCLLYPPHCYDLSCDFAVTYKTDETRKDFLQFQIIATDVGFISVGLSSDETMGDDDTMTCISNGHFNEIQRGYSPKKYNDQHRNSELRDTRIVKEEGRIFCSYSRPIHSSITIIQENHANSYANITAVRRDFNLADPVYIQLAWGQLFAGSSVLRKHSVAPLVSSSPILLLQHDTSYASALPAYLQIHAILAFVCWITISGCAMIISRHCRQLLSMKLFGAALWFQVHRSLMFLVLLGTAALIIIVFVNVGQWTKYACAHAIVGLVTAGLVTGQVAMGILRPGLDTPRRPVFNWAHRTIAILTQALSVAAMLLGVQVDLFNARLSAALIVVVIVSVVCPFIIELLLEALQLYISNNEKRSSDCVSDINTCGDVGLKQLENQDDTKQSATTQESFDHGDDGNKTAGGTKCKVACEGRLKLFLLAMFSISSLLALITFILIIVYF